MSDVANQIVTALIALVLVAFIVYRQLKSRPVSLGWLLILPLALLLFALTGLSHLTVNTATMIQLTLSVLVGLGFGYIACLSLVVGARENNLATVKGSWSYLGWFVAAMVARAAVTGLVSVIFHTKALSNSSWVIVLLSVSAFIGVRSIYVFAKMKDLGLRVKTRRQG